MTFQRLIVTAIVTAGLVDSAITPNFRTRGESLIGRREYNTLLRRQHTQVKLPDWHYANDTTKDATENGKVGVIIEPDLVLGKPGKDGATVTKCMISHTNVSNIHIDTA
jgi:hypothetical protein